MAGLTELSKTTNPVEILRILQEEAYKAELPKSEQQGLLTKPTISKDDESYGIVKFIADWWTDSEEKVKEARKEVLEGLVNMPMPTLPQPPVPDELMDVPTAESEPVIEGAPEQPEMLVPEPYKLDADTRGNELGLRGLMSPELKESIDETVSDVVTESVADGVQLGKPTEVVQKALDLNKENTTLNKDTVEEQIVSILGKNMYAASALGAFTLESGTNFDKLTEGMGYSLKNAKDAKISQSKIDKAIAKLSDADKAKLNAGQNLFSFGKALFDTAYEGGVKYRGRGLIHITHKSNYKKVGDKIGVDLVKNPELVTDPKYAVPAAIAYLDIKGFFDKTPTKNTLHEAVNPHSGSKKKKDRWTAATTYLDSFNESEDRSTSPRPMLRPDEEEE
jgi:predicted chitinase